MIKLEITMMKRIGELKAEVDNLRKKAEINTLQSTHEVARLKAEVTNLKAEADRLKAQVERLTKAGDAMAESHITLIQVYLKDSSDEWHQELHN